MNRILLFLLSLNVFSIPSLAASEAPKDTPSFHSNDWLKGAMESVAQKPKAASAHSAPASAAAAAGPASSESTQKHAAENLVRRKIIFKKVEQASYRCQNHCGCEFETIVEYEGGNDEVVEDFYKQKVPLALGLALKKQMQTISIQCTKTFMYQPPSMFPNKGVMHFKAVRKKCQRKAQSDWTIKELETEIK